MADSLRVLQKVDANVAGLVIQQFEHCLPHQHPPWASACVLADAPLIQLPDNELVETAEDDLGAWALTTYVGDLEETPDFTDFSQLVWESTNREMSFSVSACLCVILTFR